MKTEEQTESSKSPLILASFPAQHPRGWFQPEEHFGKEKHLIADASAAKFWLLLSQRDLVKDEVILMSTEIHIFLS